MKEKKARVEDAMHATRAAVEEGIVPGGGVALARCIAALDKLKVEGDEQIGVNIVKRALEEPLRQIVGNAGEEGAVIVGKVLESKDNELRLQRADQRVRRPGQGGRHRSDQSRADRAAERRLDRVADADHRSAGIGDSGREESSGGRRRTWRRHGRHVLKAAISCQLLAVSLNRKPRSGERGFFLKSPSVDRRCLVTGKNPMSPTRRDIASLTRLGSPGTPECRHLSYLQTSFD